VTWQEINASGELLRILLPGIEFNTAHSTLSWDKATIDVGLVLRHLAERVAWLADYWARCGKDALNLLAEWIEEQARRALLNLAADQGNAQATLPLPPNLQPEVREYLQQPSFLDHNNQRLAALKLPNGLAVRIDGERLNVYWRVL
jgi:hypothetical protein